VQRAPENYLKSFEEQSDEAARCSERLGACSRELKPFGALVVIGEPVVVGRVPRIIMIVGVLPIVSTIGHALPYEV
jgi:hypothetical protein